MVSLVFERRISALIEEGRPRLIFRNSNGNEEVSAQSSISSWNTADFACFNRYFDSVSRIFSKLVKSIFIINSCQTRRRGKCSRSDSFVNSPDDNLPRGKIFQRFQCRDYGIFQRPDLFTISMKFSASFFLLHWHKKSLNDKTPRSLPC